eukprot:747450-Hanusia_phi.AAC.4
MPRRSRRPYWAPPCQAGPRLGLTRFELCTVCTVGHDVPRTVACQGHRHRPHCEYGHDHDYPYPLGPWLCIMTTPTPWGRGSAVPGTRAERTERTYCSRHFTTTPPRCYTPGNSSSKFPTTHPYPRGPAPNNTTVSSKCQATSGYQATESTPDRMAGSDPVLCPTEPYPTPIRQRPSTLPTPPHPLFTNLARILSPCSPVTLA